MRGVFGARARHCPAPQHTRTVVCTKSLPRTVGCEKVTLVQLLPGLGSASKMLVVVTVYVLVALMYAVSKLVLG